MSQLEHVYWIIALISSVLFLVVLVGTVIGGGAEADMDAVDVDVDTDTGIGFQFLTFKNIVGFFTVFAWAGLACINEGASNTVTITVSSVCGLAMLFLLAWLFRFMSKQAESGTLKMTNTVGQIGEVYTTIGANRSSMGKIQIKVQGSLRELEAITDEEEDLTQGNMVRVIELVTAEMLLVEKLKKT